jgi:hypothetical protein
MSTLGATTITDRERGYYARPGRPALVGAIVAGAFASAMTLWGTLAPISGAAIANGNLQVEGRRQSVQHPYTIDSMKPASWNDDFVGGFLVWAGQTRILLWVDGDRRSNWP